MRKILLGALAVGLLGAAASRAGDLEVDQDIRAGGQLISTATSGPPLAVSSTVWVEGLHADRLDGFQASDFATDSHGHPGSGYARVLVVAESGGDFASIQAAIDSLGTTGDTDRYLVWVAPGTYSETVVMKEFVDLQGAGEGMTTIHSSNDPYTLATAPSSEIRSLSVTHEVTGSGSAIQIGGGSPRLLHVTASAMVSCDSAGKSFQARAIHLSSADTPVLKEVTAHAEATRTAEASSCDALAVRGVGSSPLLKDVLADATGGLGTKAVAVSNDGGQFLIRDSSLSAVGADQNDALVHVDTGAATWVANTRLIGTVTTSGDVRCLASFDGTWGPLSGACQ